MHIRSLLCCASGDKFADTVTSSSDARRGVSDTMVGLIPPALYGHVADISAR